MRDLSLNSDFSVHLDGQNDIATVSEEEALEQAIAISLTEYLTSSTIGEIDKETVIQKIRLQTSRVAKEESDLDAVRTIEVTPDPNDPNTYRVRVVFESDSEFSLRVSE